MHREISVTHSLFLAVDADISFRYRARVVVVGGFSHPDGGDFRLDFVHAVALSLMEDNCPRICFAVCLSVVHGFQSRVSADNRPGFSDVSKDGMFQHRVSHAGVDKAPRGAGDQFAIFQIRDDVIRIFSEVFPVPLSPIGKFCCGTEQVGLQKIRIFNAEDGFLRLCVEEGVRVVCIELVDRILSGNKGDSRFLPFSSGASCLLKHGYHRARVSADDNRIQISDVNANL